MGNSPSPPGFTCPICAAHADAVTYTIDTQIEEVYPPVEMWPGGPVVEDRSAPPQRKAVGHTISTSVCEHRFTVAEWDTRLHRDEATGREWATFTPATLAPVERRWFPGLVLLPRRTGD